MADSVYQNQNFVCKSLGVVARTVTDQCNPGQWINEDNCEELAEESVATRLGSVLINCANHALGAEVFPLAGSVHSLAKLNSLNGNAYRYAGAGGNLYRRSVLGQGAYDVIASNLSGNPWQSQSASPSLITSNPALFIADGARMLKDNGTQASPFQMGIFQPQYPCLAQSQAPDEVVLDSFEASAYTTSGATVFNPNQMLVATTLTAAVTETGIQEVSVTNPSQVGQFQSLVIDTGANQETVLVLFVTATGFIANFTKTHALGATYTATTTSAVASTGVQTVGISWGAAALVLAIGDQVTIDSGANAETVTVTLVTAPGFLSPPNFTANFTKTHASGVGISFVQGTPVVEYGLAVSVAASATATISRTFGGKPIAGWPTTLNQEDYIGMYLYVSDPTQIASITVKFDCGDGTFNSDYFYKVIAQGPLQQILANSESGTTAPTTWATDAVLDESLGLYNNNSQTGIAQLNTGLNNWTPMLLQLSDFAGAGRASFSDPVFNWQAVNGYQLTIVMNDTTSATVQLASLVLFGGSGPDTFAGVAYDYLFTFYNNVDGTESNPCMVMSNVNPPNQTNFVYPRRQPVLLTLTYPTLDLQTTSLRIYRRGGTLGDNYRRIDEVLLTGSPQKYRDVMTDADIEQSDFVSFTNDVPVTSSLQTPVLTTLLQGIPTTNSVVRVRPVSMANISVGQQVSIGTIGSLANNFETVVVIALTAPPGDPNPNSFTAFVQNSHAVGEAVSATAQYGQPVTIMAQAFGQMWFAGDPNNPNYLYWSAPSLPQAVSSAAYVQVSTPDDPITVIAGYKGNLYVSCLKSGWYSVAPGSNANASPTIYPTASKHGCVAPLGWIATEEALFYQAIDGIRAFAGGASEYLTQNTEFIWQGIGSSPIVEADQTQLSQTRAAYWCNMIFFSYVGVDGNRHRLILHTQYRRWRNDDQDCQSLLLETDTNLLIFGDSRGAVHIDRQNQAYDESYSTIAAGHIRVSHLTQNPISMNLQTPFTNYGQPSVTKSFQELTLDINTNGSTVTVTLLFEDGETSEVIGNITTTERQKFNFSLNNGLGFEYYKVSVLISGGVNTFVYVYQIGLKALALAKTRKVMDSFWLRLGQDTNSIAKDSFWEYTSSAVINGQVFYDGSQTPFFTFTLPNSNGVRSEQRVRLPAVSFKMVRFVLTSESDFQIWGDETCIESKVQAVGKGYSKNPIMVNG